MKQSSFMRIRYYELLFCTILTYLFCCSCSKDTTPEIESITIVYNPYGIVIDNIHYRFHDYNKATVINTNGENHPKSSNYSGDIVIPSSIEYDGQTKIVNEIYSYAFLGAKEMTSISLPETIENIGDWAFCDCAKLTAILIPESVKIIEIYTFMDCTSLTDIKIPNSVEKIESFAFWGCSSLSKIKLPDKVSEIDDYLFQGCKNLKSVILGPNVTRIQLNAFNDTKSPINIYCYSLSAPKLDKVGLNIDINKITFHVPKSAVDEYKKRYSSLNINIVGDL